MVIFGKEINIDPNKIIGYVTEYGLNLVFAIAIFVIGKWVAKKVVAVAKKSMAKSKLDEMLVDFIGNILYAVLLAFVIISAISELGIETTSIAAIFAAAGLAIGLALQGSLANFASGVMLIFFRPFTKGDFVEVSGTSGSVKEVNIFNTVLTTPDNKVVIIPNGGITSGNIVNYSTQNTRRIDLVMGCGYDDDIKKVKDVLSGILEDNAKVLKDPAPSVSIKELADSSINFNVRPWVKTADYWTVYSEIIEQVKIRFDAEGISIPYPQRDVHMVNPESVANENDKVA